VGEEERVTEAPGLRVLLALPQRALLLGSALTVCHTDTVPLPLATTDALPMALNEVTLLALAEAPGRSGGSGVGGGGPWRGRGQPTARP
jgi:hypothetical protein